MNAQRMYILMGRDLVPLKNWFCSRCGLVCQDKELAEKCCTCRDCGIDTNRFTTFCDDCRDLQRLKSQEKKFQEAEKLDDWDGPVYDDASDQYFVDLDELEEYYEDEDRLDDLPAFVQPCRKDPIYKACVQDFLDRYEDEMCEDEHPEPLGLKELEVAFKVFNELNKDRVYWVPIPKKLVKVNYED